MYLCDTKANWIAFSLRMFNTLSVPKAVHVLSHCGSQYVCHGSVEDYPRRSFPYWWVCRKHAPGVQGLQLQNSSATMHHVLMETSRHKETLLTKLEWMMKVRSNGKIQPDCIRGWQFYIQALLVIWEVLNNDYSLAYLLTSRLNQNPVENISSIIRHEGAQYDNPDAGLFYAAFRQCKVDSDDARQECQLCGRCWQVSTDI